MQRKAERDGRALQRIAALLFALAALAGRAAVAPFPVRLVVLAVLRRAEAIAWAFAVEAASVPAARYAGRPLPCVALTGTADAAHDNADAVRLAVSFRTLAIVVSVWATRLVASAAVLSTARLTFFLKRARPGRGWQGAAALPPPDTS
jgi:hypothetical protein